MSNPNTKYSIHDAPKLMSHSLGIPRHQRPVGKKKKRQKPKVNFKKHTHKTEFHPPTTSTVSHSLLEITHKGYKHTVFSKSKLPRKWGNSKPQPGKVKHS
jgi:hypothetical protein